MRISDWSSDVCSSDLFDDQAQAKAPANAPIRPNRRLGDDAARRMTHAMILLEPIDKLPHAAGAAGFVSRDAEDAIARHLLRPMLFADREIALLAGFDAYGRLAGLESAAGDRKSTRLNSSH